MSFRQFITRVFSVGIALSVLNVLYYVYQFLLNHTLSVVEYGIMGQLLALTVIGSLPANALGLFITRYIGLNDGEGDRLKQDHIIALVFQKVAYTLLYISFPVFLLILVVYGWKGIPVELSLLVMITIFATILLGFVRAVVYARHDVRKFAINSTIEVVLRIVATLILIYFTHDVVILYSTYMVSIVVSGIFFLPDMLAWFRYQGGDEIVIDIGEMRSQIIPTILVSLFFAFVGSIEVLMVGRILDVTASGMFAALMLLGKIVLFFLGTIITIGAPYFADSKKHKIFLTYLYLGMAIISVFILGVFYFWSTQILGIFLAAGYVSLQPFVFGFIATITIIAWLMLIIQHLSLLGYKQVGYFAPFIFLSVFVSVFWQERTFAGFIEGMFFGYLFGGVSLLVLFFFFWRKK